MKIKKYITYILILVVFQSCVESENKKNSNICYELFESDKILVLKLIKQSKIDVNSYYIDLSQFNDGYFVSFEPKNNFYTDVLNEGNRFFCFDSMKVPIVFNQDLSFIRKNKTVISASGSIINFFTNYSGKIVRYYSRHEGHVDLKN